MSGDIIDQAQSAFKGKPNPSKAKPKKRYPTPISVRFTDAERALLEEKAGDLTLSAYVRLCVLGGRLLHQDELFGANYVEGVSWGTRIYTEYETLSVGLKPDGIFSIYEKGDSNPRNYLLEIDRGTMPLRSKHFNRSSILKKYHSYADTHIRGLAKEKFGFKKFRVLFVTNSLTRKENMQELWAQEFGQLPRLCLFEVCNKKGGECQ